MTKHAACLDGSVTPELVAQFRRLLGDKLARFDVRSQSIIAHVCACLAVLWQVLDLTSNNIGDTGLIALADAAAKGSLASLVTLSLGANTISDKGLEAFAGACASGSSHSPPTSC